MNLVDLTASLDAPCSPEVLFAQVDDLDAYTRWLSIVPRAERTEADSGDVGPAWAVELRGRIGPLARSKRLRMVRTALEASRHVRFERRELDGRQHSPWVLDATVSSTPSGSRLEMQLHYGGGFGGSVVEHLLADEIDESRPRLLALVASVDSAG
jgi:hypothetical protein